MTIPLMIKNNSLLSCGRNLVLTAFVAILSGCGPTEYVTTTRQVACRTLGVDNNQVFASLENDWVDQIDLAIQDGQCIVVLPEQTVYRHPGDLSIGFNSGEIRYRTYWLVQVDEGYGPNLNGLKVIYRKDFLRSVD